MFAQIYAESLENYTTGKTSRVVADQGGIEVKVDRTAGLLALKASFKDRTTSGDRGGRYNPVTRHLRLELSKTELLFVVGGALKERLVTGGDLAAVAGLDELRGEVDRLQAELGSAKQEMERLRNILDDCAGLIASVRAPAGGAGPARRSRRKKEAP